MRNPRSFLAVRRSLRRTSADKRCCRLQSNGTRRRQGLTRRATFGAGQGTLFPRHVVVVVARHARCMLVYQVQHYIPHPHLRADMVGRFAVHVGDRVVHQPHRPSEQHGHGTQSRPRKHAEKYGFQRSQVRQCLQTLAPQSFPRFPAAANA